MLVLFSPLLSDTNMCYLQTELSVQFDDLFKKAWEEDVVEFTGDGLYDLHLHILVLCTLCLKL